MAARGDTQTQTERDDAVRAKRRRYLMTGGLFAAVAALVAVVAFVLGSEATSIAFEGEPGSASLQDVPAPAAADTDGGIPVGPSLVAGTDSGPDAVVVEVLFDYRCPYCATFEEANGPELTRLAQEGAITLVYRPVSFLDRAEGSRQYSTRAATAVALVADRAPERFVAFHEALMGHQPERGQGPSDADIAALARAAAVPENVVAQLTETLDGSSERTFARWVAAATVRGDEILGGLTTPSVLVDGERWPAEGAETSVLYERGPLTELIESRR